MQSDFLPLNMKNINLTIMIQKLTDTLNALHQDGDIPIKHTIVCNHITLHM